MVTKKRKVVNLLSGGLDSTTVLAMAAAQGHEIYAMTLQYGQRNVAELEMASKLAAKYAVKEHLVMPVPLNLMGGSSLTDLTSEIPKNRSEKAIGHGVPSTYVPARNLIFLSLAAGWAEVVGAKDIYIGVNIVDYSGYPDCRPEFIRSFEKTVRLGTAAGAEEGLAFQIHAPLSGMSKAEIIAKGTELGVDYAATHSCYDPDTAGGACGQCDSCQLRKKGFQGAGIPDPTRYAGDEQ
jgi:7-cyano-7-deazaguanine synthase